MVCRNLFERLYSKIIVGKSPYEGGKRYCRRCDVYFYQVERFCRCCGMTLRTSPAGKKRNVQTRDATVCPGISSSKTEINLLNTSSTLP
jgi:hypothetical protein